MNSFWNRTEIARSRLEGKIFNGFYKGRHLIGRDTAIDGGIYVGAMPREEIVVDSLKYPEINKVYGFAKELASPEGYVDRGRVLQSVYDAVRKVMPRKNEKDVEALLWRNGAGFNDKIALDCFIQEGVGVCRHQALLAGVLLEKFAKDGYIRGRASVDRAGTPFGAHAWARYTSYDGRIAIIDPTAEFLGTLEDAKQMGRWFYFRPEDLRRERDFGRI